MAKTYNEKVASYHANLDKVLRVFFKDEVSLASTTLEDGTIISYESLDVDVPVMIIDAEGVESPAPDGEYKIDEKVKIVVADGVIKEVIEAEAEEAVEDEAPVEAPVEAEEEVKEAEVKSTADIFNLEVLKTKVDFTKEGFHTISFSIANGVMEWGNIYSESFQELKAQTVTLSAEVSSKDKEIETLKAKFESDLKILGQTIKETKVIQAPTEAAQPVALSKKDLLFRQLDEQRKEKNIYSN